MAFIPLILSVVGSVVGAMGQMQQAKAQSDAANYQAQVAANNQQIAQENARREAYKGQVAADEEGQKTRAQLGAQLAAQGANGIDVDSGSPLSVRRSTSILGSTNQQRQLNTGLQNANAYANQATNYQAQGQLDRMQASAASSAGTIGAIGSLIGGASSFAGKWQNFSASGSVPSFNLLGG